MAFIPSWLVKPYVAEVSVIGTIICHPHRYVCIHLLESASDTPVSCLQSYIIAIDSLLIFFFNQYLFLPPFLLIGVGVQIVFVFEVFINSIYLGMHVA